MSQSPTLESFPCYGHADEDTGFLAKGTPSIYKVGCALRHHSPSHVCYTERLWNDDVDTRLDTKHQLNWNLLASISQRTLRPSNSTQCLLHSAIKENCT